MSTLESRVASVEVEDVQGLVARSYGSLKHAAYVLATFEARDSVTARAWVAALVPQLTSAARRTGTIQADGHALNLAFTRDGLEILGVEAEALASFSREFQEGMATEHRKRVLGDTCEADPRSWRWGGPENPPVHAMLFVYADTAHRLAQLLDEQQQLALGCGVVLHGPLESMMLDGDKEHFGFHDGIAQPRIAGLPTPDGGARPNETTIPAGEVVLGYPNAYGKLPASPSVRDGERARRLLPLAPPDPDGARAPQRRDLGRNGSYLVFRQLEQDVQRFWRFLDERTGGDAARRKWLASKMVGRWPNGAPLVQHPEQEPESFDPASANEFMYAEDLSGDRCPIGSHIRRTNPRDGMQPGPAESLLVADRHWLLRRGRVYGPPLDQSFDPERMIQAPDPAVGDRGLHFVCLNTDIVRQFEFVQNTWINSMKFEGLYSDPDPLIAPHVDPELARDRERTSAFTVQRCPVRHRETGVPRFVTMRGGAYLFMPGLKALHYLAGLE